jgi:WD40 repeat protein
VLSADGTIALTAGRRNQGEIAVWDVATGSRLRTLTGHHVSGISALAISPDARRALSAGLDLIVNSWDVRSGRRVSAYPEIGGFSAAILDRDEDLAMIASSAMVGLWDLATARCHRRFARATAAAWLPGAGVLVCGAGTAASVFDVAAETQLVRLVGHTERVTSVAISADAHVVISGSDDGTVRVWALDWDHRTAAATR